MMEKIIFVQRSFSPYRQRLFDKLNTIYDKKIEVVYLKFDSKRFWNEELYNSKYKYTLFYNLNSLNKIRYIISIKKRNDRVILTTDFSTFFHNLLFAIIVRKYKLWITIYDDYKLTNNNIINKISLFLMRKLIKYSSEKTLSYSSNVIDLCGAKSNIVGSQYFGLEKVYGKINTSVKKNYNKFLLISYLNQRKDIDSLLQIFKKYKSLKLFILGDGDKNYVRKLTNNPNDNINFLGYADSNLKKNFFLECSHLIFHTTKDSWGYTVAEAQYFGLDVIGNINSMAVRDLVEPNINGYHYKELTELDHILSELNEKYYNQLNQIPCSSNKVLGKNNDELYLKNISMFLE